MDGTLGTCSSAGACYAYDAEGKRVEKVAGSSTMDYLYSLDGHVIVEPLSGGGTNAEYIYADGQLVAEYANSTTRFVHEDHLGSTRLMTNLSGCIVESLDYLPFGELNSVGSASCTSADTTHKFTAKERDSESNLDNFGARYDSSQYGRFMTPDLLGGILEDPQTLNKYAYVRNNPLNLIDPTGMMDETAGGITGDNSGNPDCSELGQSYCNNVNVDWGFGIGYNGICGGDTGSCTNLFGGGSAFDGIWDESLPSGVQVFGSGGFGRLGGSTCTYGSGNCGGGVYGFTDDEGNVLYWPNGFVISITVTAEYDRTLTIGPLSKPKSTIGPLVPTTIGPHIPPKPRSLHDFASNYFPCYTAQTITNLGGTPDRQVWTGLAVVGSLYRRLLTIPGAIWITTEEIYAGISCRER